MTDRPNAGHRVAGAEQALSPIDASALRTATARLPRFGKTRYLPSVESTNANALAALRSADSAGISFVTESQGAGRGRAGRAWTSPPRTGLLLSTIMPTVLTHLTLPALGFWTSLAVRGAVETVTGFRPGLKWPNDLLAGSRKMAGILIEGETIGTASRMIVGVGINVNEPSIIPAGLADKAAWLSQAVGHLVDRTALCAALLQRYEATYDRLLERPQAVIEEWASEAGYAGREVEVSGLDGKVAYAGVVRRIDPDGALVLDTESGPVRVTLGDVAMIPRD